MLGWSLVALGLATPYACFLLSFEPSYLPFGPTPEQAAEYVHNQRVTAVVTGIGCGIGSVLSGIGVRLAPWRRHRARPETTAGLPKVAAAGLSPGTAPSSSGTRPPASGSGAAG
ncbi:hypothetical protein ACNTMW_13260 [Planosporangium sp. 12N6]|uniref:hypothetical protein n=1 Tax=Planosporangium spinosum TaxID=3402278 RepID=UPI003CF1658B